MRRLLLLSSLIITTHAAPLAAQEAAQASDRDPVTMAALNRMGAALRKFAEVNVRADFTAENVLMSGQKIQYGGTVETLARRPNQLKMVFKLGSNERELYFDGSKATLFAPRTKYYASFDAPGTIRQMLAAASDRYGLEIPLTDLFLWGDDPALEARVQEAFPAGKEIISGHMCEHHALRQESVDWQIWIREGDVPLPCKLVITSTDDPAMPQAVAVYTWKTDAVPGPETFTFKPPEGASPIVFGTLKNLRTGN